MWLTRLIDLVCELFFSCDEIMMLGFGVLGCWGERGLFREAGWDYERQDGKVGGLSLLRREMCVRE